MFTKVVVLVLYLCTWKGDLQAKSNNAIQGHSKLAAKLLKKYAAENKVLLYISKHMDSDKVAIWGQTALTGEMLDVWLNDRTDTMAMEKLLSLPSNQKGAESYEKYILQNFLISRPNEDGRIFAEVVDRSQQLELLTDYVDTVDKDSGKIFTADGQEVTKAEKIK